MWFELLLIEHGLIDGPALFDLVSINLSLVMSPSARRPEVIIWIHFMTDRMIHVKFEWWYWVIVELFFFSCLSVNLNTTNLFYMLDTIKIPLKRFRTLSIGFCSYVNSSSFQIFRKSFVWRGSEKVFWGKRGCQRVQFHIYGTDTSLRNQAYDFYCLIRTSTLWKCIKAWRCRPISPLTRTTLGITSTLRPALLSTSPPPESQPCCPPCPTCSPASRPTSPTDSVGITAGPRAARTAPHSRPAALILLMASPTRTARPSAATPVGMRPTRAR